MQNSSVTTSTERVGWLCRGMYTEKIRVASGVVKGVSKANFFTIFQYELELFTVY